MKYKTESFMFAVVIVALFLICVVSRNNYKAWVVKQTLDAVEQERINYDAYLAERGWVW